MDDLDSLLQAFDSDEEEHSEDQDLINHRTVDEIILNHSSSSPSPPSSPSNSVHHYLSNHRSVRVFPHLFGVGAVRASAKPGAALAAAAAAARSIPSPYATAIKLKRRESTAAAAADLDDSRQEAEVASDQLQSTEPAESVRDMEQAVELASNAESLIGTDAEDENHCNFPAQSETELVLDDSNVDDTNVDEREVVIPEVLPDDEGNEVDLLISGLEEAGDIGNLSSETGHSEDVSSESDGADIVEDLVPECEIRNEDDISLQKLPNSYMKQIDMAEEIEKKEAFTALHYEEGAAAQPMRLEGLRKDSTVLGYFDVNSNNAITRTISSENFRRDHGSPQVVAVHLNYIAIGMAKGSIFVLPSKYTAHHVDNMDAKMTLLGLQGDRSLVPVTSMCFNQQGDWLFAGYGDGHITVWDVQKVSALKVITEHRAPVVHMMYLGQDQVSRQFNVVSGDSKGLVKMLQFRMTNYALLTRLSYAPVKLFDETLSTVVCAAPLLYDEAHGESVVIFIMHPSALVVRVSPSIEVYAKIPKPDGVREGSMPYAAWRSMAMPHSSSSESGLTETSEKVSLLAIAWDQKVQVAKLVKSKLKEFEKWTIESPAMGLAWLDDEMLVVLTLNGQICLFAKDGSMIHMTNLSLDGFRRDDLVSYHIYFTNTLANPEKAYHNCVAVRGANIYILGPEHLVVCRLLSWKDRIEVLRKAGDWMGALNMAMTLYDGKSHGVIDLPKNLDDIRRTIIPYLVELLQAYVSEVFSYMSVACDNQNTNLNQSDDTKEGYTRVGGVAVEFCVHIRRTDILFNDIAEKFNQAHHKETFLELLEPYILKDMLGLLPPQIMQDLVEHYSTRGWLQRIEQCVLHMDIRSLNFHQVFQLCMEHRLYGALIYLFNKGLDDFRTPLEELLNVLRSSGRENAPILGYKILVYLKYCFQGLAFPPGRGSLTPARLPSLRIELLVFLLEPSAAPNTWGTTSLPADKSYPNLLHLLELDTEATLEVLKSALIEDENPLLINSQDSANLATESAESKKLIQKLVNILADILDASYFQTGNSSKGSDSIEIWPSKKDAAYIYDFIACYVACGRANVSKDILGQIFEYLTSEVNNLQHSRDEIENIKRRENQLLLLLEVLPKDHWDIPYLLHLCEKAQFHKVCGYIHGIKNQYLTSVESYMKVTDEPIYAFSFIHDMLNILPNGERDAFVSAVISLIPDLVKLSREGTYFLIINHFLERSQSIMSELRGFPESLFLYLKTVIEVQKTGTLNLSRFKILDAVDIRISRKAQQQTTAVRAYLEAISSSTKLLRSNSIHATDEMAELYFEMLCRYDRGSVLKFLETSESYRVEHCLHLCQKYGIVDAASFLLERVGDVGSALQLIISNLAEKFSMLDAELQRRISDTSLNNIKAIIQKREVADIFDILRACIGLCQRNSPRLEPDESEFLWFQLLDAFCEPLKDPCKARSDIRGEAPKEALSSAEVVDKQESKIKQKFSKSRKSARMMRKLLSVFIKEIVDGMVGYVRLPQIMLKLLSDNGNQEFGDFKPTIMGMLGTYDFEKRILDTAKSLIEDDMFYTMRLLTKGASHGYAPRSLTCCICNTSLAKSSSDSVVQVFNCGHAMHLNCDVRDTLPGCPICTPRKNTQTTSGKSVFVDEGLVSKFSSRTQQSRASSAMYPHDHDGLDNAYSSHPGSRFELLRNLQSKEKSIQIENMPQLRLAPPAVYHDKVINKSDVSAKASTSQVPTNGKPEKNRQLKDVKVKGSSLRLPLKANIFGKEKLSRR